MTIRFRAVLAACLLALFAGLTLSSLSAFAHPEDDFCTPGDDSIDPALCRELAKLDSATEVADIGGKIELDRSAFANITYYIWQGILHIVPGGTDHILFVLLLVLSERRLRPLLWQVSAFTLAHTLTLALSSLGIISPSPSWVEPLIAATILWAALETMIFKEPPKWRAALIFGFGLIHGMGFAGAFDALDLPSGLFWTSLIGFNIGVELGQLFVIGIGFAVLITVEGVLTRAGKGEFFRRALIQPSAAIIGAVALWWLITRVGGF